MSRRGDPRRRTIRRAAALLPVLAPLVATPALAQNRPRFDGVGDLPGGAIDSIAEAASADGEIVVGGSNSGAGPEAFRWTRAGGIQALGDLSGGIFSSHASGISSNGGVIVGTGVNSSDDSRAFRWTASGGMTALGAFFCNLCPAIAFGNAVSADGLVVVGEGTQQTFLEGVSVDAARWSGGGTAISNLGHLSGGGDASEASAASANGAVIVGSSDSSTGVRAFRRASSGGLIALPDIAGALVNAAATDVSADGLVIVGFANTSPAHTSQREAVRWEAPGYAPLLLGALPGVTAPGSRATAVSPDGTRIVGSANDASGSDTAFLWDAPHGMRELASVLREEYGLDLGGWRLEEARDISATNAAGEFTIVGAGIDPAGHPQGWVALLSLPACNDGVDNDGDGLADFPADPHCTAKGDRSETPDCADGLDNDADGALDFPADPKCESATDRTEQFDCSDGIDSDGDGLIDYPEDPGCRSPVWPVEDPACQNGLDDDGDGQEDFPEDLGCVTPNDRSETNDCGNRIDDDGDGLVDFPADPDCASLLAVSEHPQCSDGLDNDGDGYVDHPEAFPACQSPEDRSERPNCANGSDDDGDGLVDYPADAGCLRAAYGSESPVPLALGDLLVLDRRSRTLLRLDPASGAQTPLTSGAALTAPQGIAIRESGAIVLADPSGLLEIAPGTGAQRRFAPALAAGSSLQLVFDAAGDTVVMTKNGLSRVPFVWGGIATPNSLLAIPAPGSISTFQGDALVREQSGSLLVSGFGLLGDGIYRVAADGTSTSKVTPGFSGDVWQDLALEADGTILAAGTRFGVGPGIFRVNPSSGSVTALASGPDWQAPSAVAVAADGRIFAADAGTCTAAGCTGSAVVELSPTSGDRLHVASGGSLTGEMDLAVVTALPACANGIDDDGDGAIDFPADAQCADLHGASELPHCRNGLDDDGDGLTDFPADLGCLQLNSPRENPACADGRDNDRDGTVDWDGGPNGEPPDAFCDAPSKTGEAPAGCGLGAELAFLMPLLSAWRKRWRRGHVAA